MWFIHAIEWTYHKSLDRPENTQPTCCSQIFLVSLTIKNKSSSDMTFNIHLLSVPLRLDAVKKEYIYNLNHNLSVWCLGLCDLPCSSWPSLTRTCTTYHHYVCWTSLFSLFTWIRRLQWLSCHKRHRFHMCLECTQSKCPSLRRYQRRTNCLPAFENTRIESR